MEWLIAAGLPLFCLVVALVMIIRDPRRMRCALFATFGLLGLVGLLALWGAVELTQWAPDAAPYYVLVAVFLALLMVPVTAIFMIATGVVLIRREGLSFSHALSVLLGVGILGYLALLFFVAVSQQFAGQSVLRQFLVGIGFPLFAFSFGLVAYVWYSGVYGFVVRKWGRPGKITVVLGSGLVEGRVTPLLQRRVRLGVEVYQRAQLRWPEAFLVLSGGQGSDEPRSEAEAMREYALSLRDEQGDQFSNVLIEDASINTEQNLAFTREIMRAVGVAGPWTVATSSFHAFRAANLMSRMSIPGNAVGARSTVYFWVSAKLREYIALLAASRFVSITVFGLSLFPLLLLIVDLITVTS